jgi:hypothetical protein
MLDWINSILGTQLNDDTDPTIPWPTYPAEVN